MFKMNQLIPIFNEQEIAWLQTQLSALPIKNVIKGQMLYQNVGWVEARNPALIFVPSTPLREIFRGLSGVVVAEWSRSFSL